MPFIQQVITPVNLSRAPPTNERYRNAAAVSSSAATDGAAGAGAAASAASAAAAGDTGNEFDFFVNFTLSNVLRQLASVLAVADGIFQDLNNELSSIRTRTDTVRQKIEIVDKTLEDYDLEMLHDRDRLSIDLLSIKTSYAPKRPIDTCLFTKETRSTNLEKLYAAATLQVPNTKETYNMQICTPVLGQNRHRIKKHIDEEIETRLPDTMRDLRKWTSSEAIGDVTVRPHCISMLDYSNIHQRSVCNDSLYASLSTSYIDGIDVTIVNDEVDYNDDVPLDHTLPSPEEQCKTIAKKYPADFVQVDTTRGRFERMALIRRTIGGIPSATQKSLHERFPTVKIRSKPKRATGKRRNTISGIDSVEAKDDPDTIHFDRMATHRQTTDFSLRSSLRFTQLKAIKQWGKHRLKISNRDSKTDSDIDKPNVSNKSLTQERSAKQKKKPSADKPLKQNPLYLSPKNTFGNYFLPETTATGSDLNQVKMREAVSSRRCRRSNMRGQRIEEINSSSGNWSASSESGRTSASSENTVQTKTILSDGSTHFKRKLLDSSTPSRNGSSELSRNGELSNRDMYDDENSSIYSCDTEGYFTSFHLDSGLKTMKHTNRLDSDYGLFGKSPVLNNMMHRNGDMSGDDVDDDDSPLHHTLVHVDVDYELAQFRKQLKNDSHVIDSDFELQFPNISEMQLIDQESRLRAEKTMIDSSRIPSMSEITPSNSDEDEQIVLESLLQTLNCKPLEVLASGTEKKPGRAYGAGGAKAIPTKPSTIVDKANGKCLAISKSNVLPNIATIAKQPIRSNAYSHSLHDVSSLPVETAANRFSKYWTMPLLKKKRFLKIIKSIDQTDGGIDVPQMPSDKVPFKKCDKLNTKSAPVVGVKHNKSAMPTTAPPLTPKPIVPVKLSSLSNQTNAINATIKTDYSQSNTKVNQIVNAVSAEPKLVPKTTLMDFKKLLLTTAVKKNYERLSATELLKVSKEPQFPIQNLSYSPRALSNRRTMRGQKHASPVKKSNVLSPRSKWKYKHFDTNYITSIPEATNEEENASISSQDANQCAVDVAEYANTAFESNEPLAAPIVAPIDCAEKENDLNNAGISLKNNMFLQEEENNFMRGEVKKFTPVRKLANFEKRIDPFSEFRSDTNAAEAVAATEAATATAMPTEIIKTAEQRPTLETSF